jgi:hypothetical protein
LGEANCSFNQLSGKLRPTEKVLRAIGIVTGKLLSMTQQAKRNTAQIHATHRNLLSHGTSGRKSIKRFLTAKYIAIQRTKGTAMRAEKVPTTSSLDPTKFIFMTPGTI